MQIHLEEFILSPAIKARFWSNVDQRGGPDACWPWMLSVDDKGYGRFVPRHGVWVKASRAALAFHAKMDPGELMVCHACDNPICCNPAHLWAGDNGENQADAVAKGRSAILRLPSRGAENGNAVLGVIDVMRAVTQIMDGLTNKAIAEGLGVHHSLISAIRRGKAWGHLQERMGVPVNHPAFQPYGSL